LGKKYKLYKEGKLLLTDMKQVRSGKFNNVGKKLTAYVKLWARLYHKDKCGLSWELMQQKAMQFGANMGYSGEDFTVLHGWIAKTLKKVNKIGIILHDEAAEMSDAERARIIGDWRTTFHELIEQTGDTPSVVYNADQTGLYHTKLPNCLYVDKS
jgi:hypothetical protein